MAEKYDMKNVRAIYLTNKNLKKYYEDISFFIRYVAVPSMKTPSTDYRGILDTMQTISKLNNTGYTISGIIGYEYGDVIFLDVSILFEKATTTEFQYIRKEYPEITPTHLLQLKSRQILNNQQRLYIVSKELQPKELQHLGFEPAIKVAGNMVYCIEKKPIIPTLFNKEIQIKNLQKIEGGKKCL